MSEIEQPPFFYVIHWDAIYAKIKDLTPHDPTPHDPFECQKVLQRVKEKIIAYQKA